MLTLHGTDVELARHAPAIARRIVRRAAVVIGVSQALTQTARTLGARDARFVPNGVEVPAPAPHGADQSEVLFAGRLSPEKGIEDLLAVADGLQLVVAGDGPLRPQVPQALGMVPRGELYRLLDRAAVVVFPSRRDGFPVTCAEAMAHGRAVVATAVGGLPDMIVDGETGPARASGRRTSPPRRDRPPAGRPGASPPAGRGRPRAHRGALRLGARHRPDRRGLRGGGFGLRAEAAAAPARRARFPSGFRRTGAG